MAPSFFAPGLRRGGRLALAAFFAGAPLSAQAPAAPAPAHEPAAPAQAEVAIAQIQGAGHRSPLEGQTVKTRGIVTGVELKPDAKTGETGFWIQSARPYDSEIGTSEGIHVRIGAEALQAATGKNGLATGHEVVVEGLVAELMAAANELPVTTLAATRLEVAATGRPLPQVIFLGRSGRKVSTALVDDDGLQTYEPYRDAIDFFESLEGMRVELQRPWVTGPTTRRNELVLLTDVGKEATVLARRGAVVLRPGDDNPERFVISGRLLAKPLPDLEVGSFLYQSAFGIVDYAFGSYRILATAPFEGRSEQTIDETTPLQGTASHLIVATFNVENLSARDDEARFDQVARVIAGHLHGPDIVALQEIQDDSGPDDDGVVAAVQTLDKLVAAIAKAGGPAYSHTQVDPENNRNGGQPGGNIRPAFLYRKDRVDLVRQTPPGGDNAALGLVTVNGEQRYNRSPSRLDLPAFGADEQQGWVDSRRPLYAHFRFKEQSLFVFNAHLRSKRGDDPLFGSVQPPRRPTEQQRTAQAEWLLAVVRTMLFNDLQAKMIVLGDLNEHEFRTPMRVLAGTHLVDLIETLPTEDRYTYNYQGNAQVLDHILVTQTLAERHEPAIDVVHVNADFPESRRASDHDPVVLRLTFP
jgi:predicted extracellular nuclease